MRAVAFSRDSKRLVSASGDGTVRLWNRDGTAELTMTGHRGWASGAAWHPDGSEIASCGSDGLIRIWSTGDETPQRVMVLLPGSKVATFSAGGKLLSAGLDIEDNLVYAIENPAGGLDLLTPAEFHRRIDKSTAGKQ